MSIEYRFTASVEKVLDRLTDVDYLVDRSLALGELSAECTAEDENGQLVITMVREVERSLPSFLARLFDARQTIELVERWKKGKGRTFHGNYRMRVKGQPVTVNAEIRLKAEPGGGCTYMISHECKASIPLIGRRIESYMLTQIEEGACAELDHLARTLR